MQALDKSHFLNAVRVTQVQANGLDGATSAGGFEAGFVCSLVCWGEESGALTVGVAKVGVRLPRMLPLLEAAAPLLAFTLVLLK